MQLKALSELLSSGEAALLLGVSKDTLRRWEKAGRIRSLRLPNQHRRYRRSDLEALAQEEQPA
jgi:excisionase family DNA binding protein